MTAGTGTRPQSQRPGAADGVLAAWLLWLVFMGAVQRADAQGGCGFLGLYCCDGAGISSTTGSCVWCNGGRYGNDGVNSCVYCSSGAFAVRTQGAATAPCTLALLQRKCCPRVAAVDVGSRAHPTRVAAPQAPPLRAAPRRPGSQGCCLAGRARLPERCCSMMCRRVDSEVPVRAERARRTPCSPGAT